MNPEERAMERFIQEKQRGSKKAAMFSLEDDNEGEELTHLGRTLSFDKPIMRDDYDEEDIALSDESGHAIDAERHFKRRRLSNHSADTTINDIANGDDQLPKLPRSKKEVMEEVMAKSKLHKYERQKAKEDDDDLRAELDKGLPDLYALMQGQTQNLLALETQESSAKSNGQGQLNGKEGGQAGSAQASQIQESAMNPDRLALLQGKERSQADKEYDQRLRQMQYDQRSKPTVRTLTDDEIAQQESQKSKEMEERRVQRMKGLSTDDDEDGAEVITGHYSNELDGDDTDKFGLGAGIDRDSKEEQPFEHEDEDEFLIEDDLVASASDVDLTDVDEDDLSPEVPNQADGDTKDDFGEDLMTADDLMRPEFQGQKDIACRSETDQHIAYTYPCPQSHNELLRITQGLPLESIPTVIQRIRALHSPKLAEGNKQKLARFSAVLVDYISSLADYAGRSPFAVLETLLRHVHSLARSFPEDVGRAFRTNLQDFCQKRALAPTAGDLVLLTGISTIFPTSDHFHQVVTPAMLCMGRYLGHKVPGTLSDLATGTYIGSLCVQYQRISKRYVPELVSFLLNSLWTLLPPKAGSPKGYFPYHKAPIALRIRPEGHTQSPRQMKFWDVKPPLDTSESRRDELKQATLHTQLKLLERLMQLWSDKSAFHEVFHPFTYFLEHIQTLSVATLIPPETRILATTLDDTLKSMLSTSRRNRRPLFLHNHRPLAIKTFIPKFELNFNPESHYDPDRERAEMQKLRKEHKRERKGALRELRKDARFMAREGLKEKREKDRAYEEKYRKLVASIQGEEGKEKNEYERMKRGRKEMKRKGR